MARNDKIHGTDRTDRTDETIVAIREFFAQREEAAAVRFLSGDG